jgi:hypothetical protein
MLEWNAKPVAHGRVDSVGGDGEAGAMQFAIHPETHDAPLFDDGHFDTGVLADLRVKRGFADKPGVEVGSTDCQPRAL